MLKEKNLHKAIHFMFSEMWQNKVSAEDEQRHFEDLYRKRLGEELFEKTKSFKLDMKNHPEYDLVLTYLHNERS